MIKKPENNLFSFNYLRKKVTSNSNQIILPLLLGGCLSFPVGLEAQNIRLNFNNTTLEKALDKISKACQVNFAFSKEVIDVNRKINKEVAGDELATVLNQLFAGTNVTFREEGKSVYLTTKAQSKINGQKTKNRKITGKVLDNLGDPVIGANIQVEGTENGTITDIDGNFSIDVADGASLKISYLGYNTEYVRIGDQKSLTVKMGEDTKKLDEVVVVGYGSQRKSLVTHAISSFKPGESTVRPVLSPSELLQGRVAGVTVSTTSGNLGSQETMRIRGASSLSAGNEPLYVVDGIPLVNNNAALTNFGENMSSLSVLNLSDIESIEVLKDAASAAIYGSRGTNGVIVITTKTGREGKADVRVNLSTGVAQFANPGKVKLANSEQYLESYNSGVDNYNIQNGLSQGDKGFKEYERNPFQGLPDTDWLGLISQTGYSYNLDASVSGGNKTTNFYVGGNYQYQEGVIKDNSIAKSNLKVRVNHTFNKWFDIGANMSGNYMLNRRVPGANLGSTIIGRAIEQRPFDRPYKPNGDYYVGGTPELTRHNPLQILNEQDTHLDTYRFLGTFYGVLHLPKNINWKSSLNADMGYTYDYLYYNENHPYGKGTGNIIEQNRFVNSLLFENVLDYSTKINDIELSAMAGHSFQRVRTQTNDIDSRGFPSPSFDVSGVAAEIASAGGSLGEYAMESYFGRVNLAYDERYIFNVTMRTDGSSKFAKGNRYGYFPSASLGWNVSNEEFWKDKSTDLKIRASYGKTGNQEGIGSYAYMPLMAGGRNYMGQSGIAVSTLGNPDLSWETADQYDFGFDLGFWNGKVNMMGDVYLKNTKDLLYSMPLHATTGFTSIISNIGSMRNVGVEFSINTHFNFGKVSWNSSLNISHNKNKLTSLTGDGVMSIGDNRALEVGRELGAFYLYKMDGIYQYDGEVPQSLYDIGTRAGDVKWHDVDNNGIINDNDRVIMGSSNPDFFGGWNNTLKYKGFQLDIFFTYMYGNDVYNGAKATCLGRTGDRYGALAEYQVNRWDGPGSTNTYPRAMNGFKENHKNSDRWLEDGSFIRLRSLILGYNFSPAVLKKIKMKALRIYLQGDNLFLLTKYSGWDPEVSSNMDPRYFGVDNMSVPQPRSFNFGVNVSF